MTKIITLPQTCVVTITIKILIITIIIIVIIFNNSSEHNVKLEMEKCKMPCVGEM